MQYLDGEKLVPVRVGIIGCGRIAQRRHLPILDAMKQVHIAALVDHNSERLSRVAKRYGVERSYSDPHALLDDNSIQAVLVCTPPAEHFAHARAVLESGRHLFVEAPLALSVEECNRLVELGARSGCVATVGTNLRYHPMIQRAKYCIRDGWAGPVHSISATFTTPSRGKRGDKFPPWRKPESVDGSVFVEGAIQHFDAWRNLTSAEFDEISVQCPVVGGPVSMSATMRSEAGQSIVVAAVFSEYAGDNSEIRLMGRDGTIALSLYRYNGFDYCPALVVHGSARQHLRVIAESVRSLPQGLRTLLKGGPYGNTFRLQLEAFFRTIAGVEERVLVSLEDGRASVRASLAAIQSVETQRSVDLKSGF